MILVILITVQMSSLSVNAQEYSYGNFTYSLDGTEAIITGYVTVPKGNIVIPETINGYTVVGIDNYAFHSCEKITNVVIPNSVSVIGNASFAWCDSLKSLTIPNGVILGAGVFLYSPIENLKLTFNGYDTDVFYAFMQTLYDEEEDYTYNGLDLQETLKNLTICEGIEAVRYMAFSNHSYLESVMIPRSLDKVYGSAFEYCENLNKVYISDLADWCNIKFCYEDEECLLGGNPLDNYADLYINGEKAVNITIPKSIKFLCNTFSNCTSLKSVTIPSNVVEIQDWTFYGCSSLNYINLPNSLAEISQTAFSRCFALKHVAYQGTENRWYSIGGRDFEFDGAKMHFSVEGAPIQYLEKSATTSKDGAVGYYCEECNKWLEKEKTIYKIKTVKLSDTEYTYNGKYKKPTVKVYNSKGKVISSKYYTVSYKNNKNVGKASVTVTFKGEYSGQKTIYFVINPKSTKLSKVATSGRKALKATWKKQSIQTSGYQIQYSTSKKFKNSKTKTISSNKTTAYTINNLSANKTYYVRVRTYKTVKGKKYYSDWSSYKYKKTN